MIARLFGPFFVFAGVMHFVKPDWYVRIMALESEKFAKAVPGGAPALWARLPVQGLFIAWALAAGRDR